MFCVFALPSRLELLPTSWEAPLHLRGNDVRLVRVAPAPPGEAFLAACYKGRLADLPMLKVFFFSITALCALPPVV